MMVEFAKTMKEWDEMGVWKTDVLNNTSADNREDFKLGKTAAEQHHTQTWTDLVSKTPENVPVLRLASSGSARKKRMLLL